MASLNKVMLIGNLTRDPELRVTPNGASICSFSLAMNRKFMPADAKQSAGHTPGSQQGTTGQMREEVTYADIEAWGKYGETIAKYCTRGRPLFVEGRLRLDQWEDKQTKEKRSRMKVVLEAFQFLGSPTQETALSKGAAPASNGQPPDDSGLGHDA